MPFLSFIVCYRNRDFERVRLFLESIKAIDSTDFELIFVDYGSDEGISENIKKIVSLYSFANYHFYNSRGQNWNRAKCLNYGYTLSKGQYVFTSDIDFLYSKNFVSIIKEMVTPTHAFYFKVGFLTERQSRNVDNHYEKIPVKSYSDEAAIGALLISRQMFDEIGGYDEFYEIWGGEDNDILKRLKLSSYDIEYCPNKNLIWHIWHLPARKSDILPEGWVKFLLDYFENKFSNQEAYNLNYYCKLDSTRPIIAKLEKCNDVRQLFFSPSFLKIYLKQEISKLNQNDVICFKFNFEEYLKYSTSNLNKLVIYFNRIFKFHSLPINLYNTNMLIFPNKVDTRDELQYFIKDNLDLIKDYYLYDDLVNDGVYFMKR